jgi:uncharacterized protein (DUF3820 family)
MKEPTYQDDDKMPFGKYKGILLQDVPAEYLHWWWTNTSRTDTRLKHYIENNLEALKMEDKDKIWS